MSRASHSATMPADIRATGMQGLAFMFSRATLTYSVYAWISYSLGADPFIHHWVDILDVPVPFILEYIRAHPHIIEVLMLLMEHPQTFVIRDADGLNKPWMLAYPPGHPLHVETKFTDSRSGLLAFYPNEQENALLLVLDRARELQSLKVCCHHCERKRAKPD